MSPVTCHEHSQSTLLLALLLAPLQLWECSQLAQMPFRRSYQKATSAYLPKSGTRTHHNRAPGPTMGATELAQTPALPPHAHAYKAHSC